MDRLLNLAYEYEWIWLKVNKLKDGFKIAYIISDYKH